MMRPFDRRHATPSVFRSELERTSTGPAVSLLVSHSGQTERIRGTRLLIGSDATCDVHLESSEAPGLHSIVHRDRDGVWLDVVVGSPSVLLHNVETRWARLRNGDVLRIGTLRITVEFQEMAGAATARSMEPDESAITIPLPRRAQPTAIAADRSRMATAMLRAALEEAVPDSATESEQLAHDGILPLSAAYPLEAERSARSRRGWNELITQLEELAARTELLARDFEDRRDEAQEPGWSFLLAADNLLDQLEELLDGMGDSQPQRPTGVRNPRIAA